MYIHAYVNQRDHRPSTAFFKLGTLAEPIKAAEHYVAGSQRIKVLLPFGLNCPYFSIGTNGFDHSFRDRYLGGLRTGVGECRTNRSVQIWEVEEIRVEECETTYAEICGLLRDVRATASQTDNSDSNTREKLVAMLAEKALTDVNGFQKLPPRNRMGNPTAVILEILMGLLISGYQQRPAAALALSTRVPWGNIGFTFQKSGT